MGNTNPAPATYTVPATQVLRLQAQAAALAGTLAHAAARKVYLCALVAYNSNKGRTHS